MNDIKQRFGHQYTGLHRELNRPKHRYRRMYIHITQSKKEYNTQTFTSTYEHTSLIHTFMDKMDNGASGDVHEMARVYQVLRRPNNLDIVIV